VQYFLIIKKEKGRRRRIKRKKNEKMKGNAKYWKVKRR
jgi:hypothetical protein